MTAGVSDKSKSIFARMAAGAVVGAAAAGFFLGGMAKGRLDLGDPGAMLAVVAGLSYALMGIAVGFGALAPRAGARFLNVEDAEELREQRRSLAPSAAVCLLTGLFLLTLAAGPSLALSFGREITMLAAAASLAAAILIAVLTRGRSDEMIQQIGLEASAYTLHIALVGLGLWAALAEFGYVGWTSPLALVAGLALLQLAAIFVVSALRGVMQPR